MRAAVQLQHAASTIRQRDVIPPSHPLAENQAKSEAIFTHAVARTAKTTNQRATQANATRRRSAWLLVRFRMIVGDYLGSLELYEVGSVGEGND